VGKLTLKSKHRLLIDDCTMKENVERLMAGERADMVFTDPPYGMNLDTDWSEGTPAKDAMSYLKSGNPTPKEYAKVEGDSADFDPTHIFDLFQTTEEVFIWGADYYCERIPKKNNGSWVVWDKRCDESADKAFGASFELCWSRSKHKREIARIRSGIFGVKDDSKTRVHPTQKPTQLAEWFFERWGKDATNIWDGYLGSGSTLIACEKTDRRCFGMEIEPLYGDVILSRFAKFSGKDSIRESDGVSWSSINQD
jgi:DNA modification methylase